MRKRLRVQARAHRHLGEVVHERWYGGILTATWGGREWKIYRDGFHQYRQRRASGLFVRHHYHAVKQGVALHPCL